jgi:hypothetical protein
MNTKVMYSTDYQQAFRTGGSASKIKQILLKAAGIFEFDADNIAKSKDWPFLWTRKSAEGNEKLDRSGVEKC